MAVSITGESSAEEGSYDCPAVDSVDWESCELSICSSNWSQLCIRHESMLSLSCSESISEDSAVGLGLGGTSSDAAGGSAEQSVVAGSSEQDFSCFTRLLCRVCLGVRFLCR